MGAAPERLKQRREFLRVARSGRKWVAPGLILQVEAHIHEVEKAGGDIPVQPAIRSGGHAFRIGFTVSRKVGGAVVRNRVKRRLRAVVDAVMPEHAAPGNDYVVIGRGATARRPFDALSNDLETALKRLGAWRDGDGAVSGKERRDAS